MDFARLIRRPVFHRRSDHPTIDHGVGSGVSNANPPNGDL
jgi:hypothetical protein